MGAPMKMHRWGCPGVFAWDVPGACNCDGPTLTLHPLRRESEPAAVTHDDAVVEVDAGETEA